MDGGARWATVHGVTKSRIPLSDFFHFKLSCIGEGNGNPLQCFCLENPRDGGAWWAAVYGVTQSRTRLKWLSSSSRKSRTTWSKRQIGLGVQNKADQRLTEFCQEDSLVIGKTLFQQHKKKDSTHGYHQMVNTQIRLIIFFAAKDGQLYTVSKNKTRSWLWLRSWTPYCQIQT